MLTKVGKCSSVLMLAREQGAANESLIEVLAASGHEVSVKYLRSFDDSLQDPLHDIDLLLVELAELNPVVLRILRGQTSQPIVVLGGDATEEGRIECLRLGADDCLATPYSAVEVELRISAILKRSQNNLESLQHIEAEEQLIVDDQVVLDRIAQSVSLNGEVLSVTPVEFKLLWLLMYHRGRVLSKSYTYQLVLGREYGAFDRAIDMHLSRVKKKLASIGFEVARIKTVRGQGYSFC